MNNDNNKLSFKIKAKIAALTAAKIAPVALIAILAGNYVIDSFGGEIISLKGYEDLEDKYTAEQTYEPETNLPGNLIIEENEDETLETENNTETKEETEKEITIDYPEFIPNEDKQVEISRELLDEGFKFESVDFEGLRTINPDITAWVEIPGTNIDYPIVQGDDNSHYLKHDFYGNYTDLGSIYADSRQNSLESEMSELNDISIIYGHNFSGKRMFNEICNYKSERYYDDHKFGIVYTSDGYAYKVDFFAGVVIDGSDDSALYTADFIDEDVFNAYIQNLKDNSRFQSELEIEFGDKIIALTTCSYETNNSRFVLYGKLSKQYTYESQIEQSASLRLN